MLKRLFIAFLSVFKLWINAFGYPYKTLSLTYAIIKQLTLC